MTPETIAIAVTSAALITAATPNHHRHSGRHLAAYAGTRRLIGTACWALTAPYAADGDTAITACLYAAITAGTWLLVTPPRPRARKDTTTVTAAIVTISIVTAVLVAGGVILAVVRDRAADAEFTAIDADFRQSTAHLIPDVTR